MFRLIISVLLATVIATAVSTSAQTPAPDATTGTLQGHITDNSGTGIPAAFAYVQGNNDISQQVPVNEKGDFTVQLPPGIYNFFVGSLGFTPYAKEIKIIKNKPLVLKIKLPVDYGMRLEN